MKVLLSVTVLLAIGISAYLPHADWITWCLEAAPVFVLWPVLILVSRRRPLSTFSFVIATIHALILLAGAHYTYAKVPLGDAIAHFFDFERNHFDRLGHFFQGFSPAFVLADALDGRSRLSTSRLFGTFLISFSLAFSALYEILEWWSAVILGDGAQDFLGSQGDIWDAQWDMFMALSGSICAVLLWRSCASRLKRVKKAY